MFLISVGLEDSELGGSVPGEPDRGGTGPGDTVVQVDTADLGDIDQGGTVGQVGTGLGDIAGQKDTAHVETVDLGGNDQGDTELLVVDIDLVVDTDQGGIVLGDPDLGDIVLGHLDLEALGDPAAGPAGLDPQVQKAVERN